jgi:hypothetical protein
MFNPKLLATSKANASTPETTGSPILIDYIDDDLEPDFEATSLLHGVGR